jgi:polyferredoxin
MLVVEAVLWPVAALMAFATAILVKRATEAQTPVRAAVVVFLLLMMTAMLAGLAIYYHAPGPGSLVTGLWLSSGLMSAGALLLIFLFLRPTPTSPPPGGGARDSGFARVRTLVASVVGLVLTNELLMGWAFGMAAGQLTPGVGVGGTGVLGLLVRIVNSDWFLFTMSGEMVLTAILLRDRLSPTLFGVLALQSGLMFLSPPAMNAEWWRSDTLFPASAAMIALFVFLMEWIYRNKQINAAFSQYTVRLLAIYGVMMAGLYLWLRSGAGLVFAVSIVLEMLLFFDAILLPDRFRTGARISWQLKPHWAFQVLLFIFVSEIFMGALLDLQIGGSAFAALLPAASLSGAPLVVVNNAFYNAFWFLALVAGSAWFLLMMGVEMGALVVFKMRETRQTELRARLGLMVGAFALTTVYFPGFWFTLPISRPRALAQVPVLGWGMGIGSSGPLAPTFFVAILVSYLAIGAASFLFGRRVLCSVLCSAPLMFQGTLIDSMRTFNRSSPFGRKFLSSRLSTTYSVTSGVVLSSLVAFSVVSYFDSVGRLGLFIWGKDPTQFLFAFYFGVLWYVLFVTIPYTGNYNCVTMGWCHWGTFSQAFSRLGFFRLKVRDREVCLRCTTLDCAKSCPVGLVDMPGHFRTKGEFRSSKCCGVGDCVAACPYGNMYIYDVRHWIRQKLGLSPRAAADLRLPMVRPSRPSENSRPAPSTATPVGPL